MSQDFMTDQEKILRKLLAERILFMDGAMGTMIQQHKLSEEDYRVQMVVLQNFQRQKDSENYSLKATTSY